MSDLKRVAWVIVILFASAVLVSAGMLLFPTMLPQHLWNLSDRLGLATYLIGVVGLAALVFAGLEFFQAQARPNLDLIMQPLRQMEAEGELTHSNKLKQLRKGGVDVYYFDLLLLNNGDAGAERVRVSLRLEGTHPKEVGFFREPNGDPMEGCWSQTNIYHQAEEHIFQGGANLVIYTRPAAKLVNGWREKIGTLYLEVPVNADRKLTVPGYEMRYSIHADRFEKVNGVFEFV